MAGKDVLAHYRSIVHHSIYCGHSMVGSIILVYLFDVNNPDFFTDVFYTARVLTECAEK